MKKTFKMVVLVLTFALILCSCGQSGKSSEQPKDKKQKVELTISAAASLTDAMKEIKDLYVAKNPNVAIVYNFGSSGSLQQQIENGAPVDVFLSAAQKQMKALSDKGLIIENTKKDFVKNKVVLTTTKDNINIKKFTDLASDSVKKVALGEPKSVPVGQYSEEILKHLNISDKVYAKAVFAKDVKEVLTWVETGNVDAGIVYSTDAALSKKINIVATAPENTHSPIVYPAAVIKNSKNVEDAKKFENFLFSADAKKVFAKFGFTALD